MQDNLLSSESSNSNNKGIEENPEVVTDLLPPEGSVLFLVFSKEETSSDTSYHLNFPKADSQFLQSTGRLP